MKRFTAALFLICALLSACKGKTYESITEKYADKDISCTARITLFGEYGNEFTVSFKSGENGDKATIISPESIAGISADISNETAELSYDGKSLELPLVSYRETAPVTCLSSVFETIRTSVPNAYSEKERRLDYINGDVTKTLIFNENGELQSGEILLKGETVLKAEITSLTLD